MSNCFLGDDGVRPLLEALPANTHLRTLRCSDNNMTEVLARDVLLPAVRANTSLRTLVAGERETASEAEAVALVARRSR